MAPRLSIGLVGAGRSRNGLGPYLARFLEAQGCGVVAIAGRDAERTRAVAAAMAQQHGHAVEACADAAELCSLGLDALVIASPPASHLAALQAAAAAGIACLCEKPLVDAEQREAGDAVLRAFAARDLLLVENCQWPWALGAFQKLHGPVPDGHRDVELGLSPTGLGPTMLRDSLSHLLSVVQALAGDLPTRLVDVARDDHGHDAATTPAMTVTLRLRCGEREVVARLVLRHQEHQPRPAWLAIDGRRIDRVIGAAYEIGFAAAGRTVAIGDPLQLQVRAFAAALRGRDAEVRYHERRRITERHALYCSLVARSDA